MFLFYRANSSPSLLWLQKERSFSVFVFASWNAREPSHRTSALSLAMILWPQYGRKLKGDAQDRLEARRKRGPERLLFGLNWFLLFLQIDSVSVKFTFGETRLHSVPRDHISSFTLKLRAAVSRTKKKLHYAHIHCERIPLSLIHCHLHSIKRRGRSKIKTSKRRISSWSPWSGLTRKLFLAPAVGATIALSVALTSLSAWPSPETAITRLLTPYLCISQIKQ